jgi:hypothetical protein
VYSAFVHWCEVCGLEVLLTPEIAYELGWDFPPGMGEFGIISPRTCGACGVEGTVWFDLAVNKKTVDELTNEQYAKALRILKEKDDPRLERRVGHGAV